MTEKFICKITALFIVAVVLSTVCFSACSCSDGNDGRERAEAFLPNVLAVTSEGSVSRYGSAVAIKAVENGKVLCLTNYHVVMDADTVTAGGMSAEVLGYSAYHDIAVLAIPYFEGFTSPEFSFDAVSGKTYSIGNLGGNGVKIFDGETVSSSTVISTLRLTGDTSEEKRVPVLSSTSCGGEGMSGGALLDGRGRLVGIVTYGEYDNDNFCYCVPISVASAVLDAAESGDGGALGLFGAGLDGYGVGMLTSPEGGIGVLVDGSAAAIPHSRGWRGVLQTNGIMVTAAGGESGLVEGDIITEVGRVKVSGKSSAVAIFGELYGYSSDGAGEPLTLTTSRGKITVSVLKKK